MIKIECTKDEQERILYILDDSIACPLGLKPLADCPADDGGCDSCVPCLMTRINWVITDE